MTKDKASALYYPIRASVRRVLSAAIPVCTQSDLCGPRSNWALARREDLSARRRCCLRDAQRYSAIRTEPGGRRAFDVFLGGKARKINAADFELGQRMGEAFFSLFRCAARHEVAGIWLEDLLDDNRKIWLVDEGMEASAPIEGAFGMRIFDAGEFHVGFGIVTLSDDETTEFSTQGVTRNGRVPFRHSLAVTLYFDACARASAFPGVGRRSHVCARELIESRAGSRRVNGARSEELAEPQTKIVTPGARASDAFNQQKVYMGTFQPSGLGKYKTRPRPLE